MTKTIVVFGVSGQIGYSIAKALSGHYEVKGISRNPDSQKCQILSSEGIQIIQKDAITPRSLDRVLEGAYGCFVMTHSDFSQPLGEDQERQQGIVKRD